MDKVRVRFAPSPTGFLHIGGARTALFNWLFARHNKGEFILRIEDTDTERSTDEATNVILDGMRWLGLDWDEGPDKGGPNGPYFQSQRTPIYRQWVQKALDAGLAYRCYATKEELEAMRELKMSGQTKTAYDRRWRDKGPADWPADQPYVIRFKMPTEGICVVEDMIQGHVEFPNDEMEDIIIARADGSPIYNFCVVVDDHLMGISHVVRGVDHLNNTALQIHIYKAFGLTPPRFGHVGLIHGPDGKKYSKRHGAVAVTEWRDAGYLPQVLRNYLVRLGWAYGDQEIFTLEEMIEHFTIEAISKSASIVNPSKMEWLSQQYLQSTPPAELVPALAAELKRSHNLDVADDPRLPAIIKELNTRSKTMLDMASGAVFFFARPAAYDEKADAKFLTSDMAEPVKFIFDGLSALPEWKEESIQKVFEDTMAKFEMKLGKIAQPVRIAITGTTVSPGIFESLVILGRDESLVRIEKMVKHIAAKATEK